MAGRGPDAAQVEPFGRTPFDFAQGKQGKSLGHLHSESAKFDAFVEARCGARENSTILTSSVSIISASQTESVCVAKEMRWL